jgi:hypothetical protein
MFDVIMLFYISLPVDVIRVMYCGRSRMIFVFRLVHWFQNLATCGIDPFETVVNSTVLYCTVLTVTQSVQTFPTLYWVRGFVTCSQDPTPILYPSQLNPVQNLTSCLFKMHVDSLFTRAQFFGICIKILFAFFLCIYHHLNVKDKEWLHCSFAFRI